jgi:hypothetical protein
VGGAHGSAQNHAAAAAQRQPSAERVGDVEMRKRVQAEARELLAMVLLKEMARLAGTGVGDYKPDVKILNFRDERVDTRFLGEIDDHAPRFYPATTLDFFSERAEQFSAPCCKDDVKSFGCKLAHEFGADTG